MKTLIQNSIILLFFFVTMSACSNFEDSMGDLTTLSPNVIPSNLNLNGGAYTHTLSRVTVTEEPRSNQSSEQNYILSLAVDASGSNFKALNYFCGTGTTLPCLCELKWIEENTVGSTTESVSRTRKFQVFEVQPGIVKCRMPSSFYYEIPAGVSIGMDILPDLRNGNASGLNVDDLSFKKGSAVTDNGDFFDDTLTPFKNIHRYTCHSKRQTTHEIINAQIEQGIPPDNESTANVMTASQFCTESGSGSSSKICSQPRTGYSAQSYYRNLYVASDKIGDINATNNSYECPQVMQSIKANLSVPAQTTMTEKSWPLDTTFALAAKRNPDWSVGVEAVSILAAGGDPDSVPEACIGTDPKKRFADSGLITKCLGYAKKPKLDGSCGVMKDKDNKTRPLVRLRRYRAVFPPYFDSTGKVLSDRPIEADEVYVPDRIVVRPLGGGQFTSDGNMIYGPKPCNIAWFDHEGAVKRPNDGIYNFESSIDGGLPSYVGTNDYFYKNTNDSNKNVFLNPDGQIFPNKDQAGDPGATGYCSAALPLIDRIMGVPSRVYVSTTSKFRSDVDDAHYITVGGRKIWLGEVHVRPIEPWTPNYVEDTGFQACVPASDPYLEPPLHLYSDTINGKSYMSWCAKVYPTHNPYWYELNRKRKVQVSSDVAANIVGWKNNRKVDNFTSHDSLQFPAHKTIGVSACHSYNKVCEMTTYGSTVISQADCMTFLSETAGSTRKYASTGVDGKFCDRTVKYDPMKDFRSFPLQASDDDVKSMLKLDSRALEGKNFSCTFSYHSDKSKIGKAIPTSGCCGVVSGTPVLSPILDGLENSAHMEPYLNNDYPDMRYCGNPVEY